MSKGVIWASEYSLGPQIWGPGGGPGPRAPPTGSATEYPTICMCICPVTCVLWFAGSTIPWLMVYNRFQWRIQDFPYGGRGPCRGGVDSWGGYVSKILYVKTRESGPLRGRAPGTPLLDPPMAMMAHQRLPSHNNAMWRHCNDGTSKITITPNWLVHYSTVLFVVWSFI